MKLIKLIDRLPLIPLAVVAVFMTLAPVAPEPHLWQKLKMLAAGTLVRPLDVFDLFWHGVWPVLFAVRTYREFAK